MITQHSFTREPFRHRFMRVRVCMCVCARARTGEYVHCVVCLFACACTCVNFPICRANLQRVFDEAMIPVTLPVIGAALLPTSDHYGVQVSVRAINPPATSDAAKSGALLALLISALIVSVSL